MDINTKKCGYTDVVAGVIVKDGKVLAGERSYGSYEGFWEYPGGKVESGESKEDALIRELDEEMNLNVQPDQINYFDTFYHSYPDIDVALHIYIIRCDVSNIDCRVHHQFKWLDSSTINSVKWLESTYFINDELIAHNIIH